MTSSQIDNNPMRQSTGGQTADSQPILEVRDLVKDFGGVRAVDHCSLDVMPGTITGLIGPNGAGKTTLFNLISGFHKLTAGTITFLGKRIDGMEAHETFHTGLVRTFQIPREFKYMTVLENLMLVPSNQAGERIWASWFTPWRIGPQERAIERQALETLEFLNLDHLKDEYAANLSGGQKKLLELGRTLMAKPKMILLDEPSAGVSPALTDLLMEDIRRAQEETGITILIIEHNMRVVMSLCDPVIVLSEGRKLMEGTPYEVQRNEEVLRAYLGFSGEASAAADENTAHETASNEAESGETKAGA